MENYEQKYKEALKIMESLHSVVKYQSSSDALLTSQTIEKAFPELRESEDEKIRKELIDIVKKSPITFAFEDKGKVLAWLEKQNEKTIPKNIDDAALQYVDTCTVDGEVTHGNITEPYWNNHSMMNAYKAGWLEKQGEQKPAWSEEDEKMLESAIWHVSYSASNGKSTDYQCQVTDWLKSIKPIHWKPSEQNIKDLEWCADLVKDKMGVGFHRLQVFIDKLKNL